MAREPLTLGVEEEYQVVDPDTRALRPEADAVLQRAEERLNQEVQPELRLSQIEIASPVCRTLAEVRAELIRLRRELIDAAAKEGNRLVAAGTHPFSAPESQPFTPKPRYMRNEATYQALARELVIFGCHVHVGVEDPDAALQVLNRARVWLSPLLALGASSPFWQGEDTGYASFRTELWIRYPTAGPPQLFASRGELDQLVRDLVEVGMIADESFIYWDIRLPKRVPTVEFRVADVCPTVDEAVMLAGLVRALVQTCFGEAEADREFPQPRHELLRAAHWRAARYGLTDLLVDLNAGAVAPAPEVIDRMLTYVRPALEEVGDWDEVSALVQETLQRGTAAERQREAYARTGSLESVVDHLIDETARGVG